MLRMLKTSHLDYIEMLSSRLAMHGEREKARMKRVAQLEAEADKKPPHLTGRR